MDLPKRTKWQDFFGFSAGRNATPPPGLLFRCKQGLVPSCRCQGPDDTILAMVRDSLSFGMLHSMSCLRRQPLHATDATVSCNRGCASPLHLGASDPVPRRRSQALWRLAVPISSHFCFAVACFQCCDQYLLYASAVGVYKCWRVVLAGTESSRRG